MLPALINRDRPVTELRRFYRGQSGLSKFEQIVEREIWMQRGWDWLDYRKTGQVLAQDEENADWAEVRLAFAALDGQETGTYEARVEACGVVTTAHNSGGDLVSAKQYRVSHLKLVV